MSECCSRSECCSEGDGDVVDELDGEGDEGAVNELDGEGDEDVVDELDGEGDGDAVNELDGEGDGDAVNELDGDKVSSSLDPSNPFCAWRKLGSPRSISASVLFALLSTPSGNELGIGLLSCC